MAKVIGNDENKHACFQTKHTFIGIKKDTCIVKLDILKTSFTRVAVNEETVHKYISMMIR